MNFIIIIIISKNKKKNLINRVCESPKTPEKMAALINALSCLDHIIEDDAFGEYDEKSTLKPTPRSSLRSNDKY